MKKVLIVLLLGLTSCGYSSKQNEAIGQVKKVVNNTPLICSNFVDTDISLGVMINGVGSMSHEDIWFYVVNSSDIKTLKIANENGKLVKITYDVRRFTVCVSDHFVTSVTILESK